MLYFNYNLFQSLRVGVLLLLPAGLQILTFQGPAIYPYGKFTQWLPIKNTIFNIFGMIIIFILNIITADVKVLFSLDLLGLLLTHYPWLTETANMSSIHCHLTYAAIGTRLPRFPLIISPLLYSGVPCGQNILKRLQRRITIPQPQVGFRFPTSDFPSPPR